MALLLWFDRRWISKPVFWFVQLSWWASCFSQVNMKRWRSNWGDPTNHLLASGKVIFLSACLEVFFKDGSVLTHISYSLSLGVGGIDLNSVCTSQRCAVSFGIIKWRLSCSWCLEKGRKKGAGLVAFWHGVCVSGCLIKPYHFVQFTKKNLT